MFRYEYRKEIYLILFHWQIIHSVCPHILLTHLLQNCSVDLMKLDVRICGNMQMLVFEENSFLLILSADNSILPSPCQQTI